MQNEPRIAATAYRHGIGPEDTLHAYQNAITAGLGSHNMDIAVGPATDGTLLEVGFIRANGETVILHSMPARTKFLPRRR